MNLRHYPIPPLETVFRVVLALTLAFSLTNLRLGASETFLRINEIQARGPIEWIELYNPKETPETLAGYHLEIEKVGGEVAIHRLPRTVRVPPGGFIAICTGCDAPEEEEDPDAIVDGFCPREPGDVCLRDPGNGCQRFCFPFELDGDGGVVTLHWQPACKSKERRRVDSVRYPPLPPANPPLAPSFGRRGEPPEWCLLETETPAAANTEDCVFNDRQVSINEISTAEAIEPCTFSTCPDWVELVNPGPIAVDLSEFRLASGRNVFVFRPGARIEAESFLLLILSDAEPQADWPAEAVRVPFNLSSQGDSIILSSPDGRSWDRVSIPRLGGRECHELYARIPDDGPFSFTKIATPGLPNRASESFGPCCSIVSSSPLRPQPGEEIEIFARVTDRDGLLASVELHWRFGEGATETVSMEPAKRNDCDDGDDTPNPGRLFVGRVPGTPAGVLEAWATAVDAQENRRDSEAVRLRVHPPAWTDPDAGNPTHLLRVNEVSARGDDWVELYNPTSQIIWLRDLIVTNNPLTIDGRRLHPDSFIPPRGFFRAILDGTAEPNVFEPHLPFRLRYCSDSIAILHLPSADAQLGPGHVIDHLTFREEKAEHTLGRHPDGVRVEDGGLLTIMTPTPLEPNAALRCFDFHPRPRTLVINEVLSDNDQTYADVGEEHGDWIELYNPSESMLLDGWSLADSTNSWEFPDGICLPADARLLVWCDNDECENIPENYVNCGPHADREIHTNFELSRLSDFVELRAPDGSTADRASFRLQMRDVSIARVPDGAPLGEYGIPTPGEPNVRRELPAPLDPCGHRFRRGDANSDCDINITDATFLLNWLFLASVVPDCLDAADVDDGGQNDLTDAIYLLNHLFLGGAAPPEPFRAYGFDLTIDPLSACRDSPCQE